MYNKISESIRSIVAQVDVYNDISICASSCFDYVVVDLLMGYRELSCPEWSYNISLVPMEDMLLTLHGIEGICIAIVTIITSHACNITRES